MTVTPSLPISLLLDQYKHQKAAPKQSGSEPEPTLGLSLPIYLSTSLWPRGQGALSLSRSRRAGDTGCPGSWWGGTGRRSQQGCPPLPASRASQQPALPSTSFPQFSLCFSSPDMAEQLLMVKLRAVFHLLGDAGGSRIQADVQQSKKKCFPSHKSNKKCDQSKVLQWFVTS